MAWNIRMDLPDKLHDMVQTIASDEMLPVRSVVIRALRLEHARCYPPKVLTPQEQKDEAAKVAAARQRERDERRAKSEADHEAAADFMAELRGPLGIEYPCLIPGDDAWRAAYIARVKSIGLPAWRREVASRHAAGLAPFLPVNPDYDPLPPIDYSDGFTSTLVLPAPKQPLILAEDLATLGIDMSVLED